MNDPVEIEVYFDIACPFVHNAALWLAEVQRQIGEDRVIVNWRAFPLEQVNAPEDAEFALWDLPAERKSRGRDSLHAVAAAGRQSPQARERYLRALLSLKHEEQQDHGRRSVLLEAARRSDLDLMRFEADLEDRSLLAEIRDDYLHGRDAHGVFGTPTFVFGEGQAAYLQLKPVPDPEAAASTWNDFVSIVQGRPSVREIKRPKPPVA